MIKRSTPSTQLAGAPGEAIEDVSCLGVGLIIRTAAEAEVDAFLDRPRLSTHRRCGSADWAGRIGFARQGSCRAPSRPDGSDDCK